MTGDWCLQDLTNRESLHCIQTVFTILSGQGQYVCRSRTSGLTHGDILFRPPCWIGGGSGSEDCPDNEEDWSGPLVVTWRLLLAYFRPIYLKVVLHFIVKGDGSQLVSCCNLVTQNHKVVPAPGRLCVSLLPSRWRLVVLSSQTDWVYVTERCLFLSGDVLNIDPLKFYSQVYKMLPQLNAGLSTPPQQTRQSKPVELMRILCCDLGAHNDDVIIVLRCLDSMLIRRRKAVTLQRAMAFVKRLSMLSLHVLPNASVGILAMNRAVMQVPVRVFNMSAVSCVSDLFVCVRRSRSATSCWTTRFRAAAFTCRRWASRNTATPRTRRCGSCTWCRYAHVPHTCTLWPSAVFRNPLPCLQRHYHSVVRRFAAHLTRGAPSDGSAALSPDLSRR